MKQFIAGVITGIIGDRVLSQNVSNQDIVSEVRSTLKRVDERLAEAEKQAAQTDTPGPGNTVDDGPGEPSSI